jgi:uncharacterized protein YraI
MLRRVGLLALTAILVLAVLAHPGCRAVRAQDGPDGWTTYRVNMRTGPGTAHPVITTLAAGAELFLEARNANVSWLLARTTDGVHRGWVSAVYVGLSKGYGSPANLPVSKEIVASQPVAPAAAPAVAGEPGQGVVAPVGAEAAVAVLANRPVIPAIGPRVYEIFRAGQALGNRRDVFTIVGGCNSLAAGFMIPFGTGNYSLGPYGSLQPTVDYFLRTPVDGVPNSFAHKGVAVRAGYTAAAITDPAWADPAYCQGGESPLTCEYRRSKPAVAFVLLGVLDVYWFTPPQFEYHMRQIIETSIAQGVIPVITTFPTTAGRAGDAAGDYDGAISFDDRAVYRAEFDLILVNLAAEYGVPLMNLWRAARDLPRSGFREGDFIHFWEPDDASTWGSFAGAQHKNIFAMWNLIALQTLDVLRTGVFGG